jgi:hypothetical protein
LPPERLEVVYVATSLLTLIVARVVEPSLNVTVPLLAEKPSFAVNVTVAAYELGSGVELNVMLIYDALPPPLMLPEK